MFAIVEFSNKSDDSEGSGEISIVPILWLIKNQKKCYWPSRLPRGVTFTEFVMEETPYKKTWPVHKIYKIYFKTENYNIAEEKLHSILNDNISSIEASGGSLKLLTRRKTLDNSVTSDTSDSASANTSSEDDEVNKPAAKKSMAFTTGTVKITCSNDASSSSAVNICTRNVQSTANQPNTVFSEGFQTEVLKWMATISSNMETHSGMLSELLSINRSRGDAVITVPENLPPFPFKSIDEFEEFDTRIQVEADLRKYMIRRLSAIGGSGVDSLTRRILKFMLTNEVAMQFNWKGRDKKSFEKTNLVQVIYGVF